LRRACFSGKDFPIRNSYQDLKIRRDDMKMRRPVIVGIHTNTGGPEALQDWHAIPSYLPSATIAL
jgi:hypothetical protein